MAVAFDAAATGQGAASPISWSHTVGVGGANRLLIVTVSTAALKFIVSGITYAGTAMTLIVAGEAQGKRLEVWGLVAPATGLNTVTVTAAPNNDAIGGSMSWTGASQTLANHTTALGSGNDGNPTVTIASAVNDFVMDTVAPTNAPTVGAGQTQNWNLVQGGVRSAGSTKPGAASVTMSWTQGASPWMTRAVNVKQVGAAAGSVVTPRLFALLGVGA